MATEDDVRELAMALPEVTEKTSYGTPAFYVRGKIFARIHDRPGILVCWRSCTEDRQELLDSSTDKFFTADHYKGHPSVLLRLERVEQDELRELLIEAWESRAPKRLAAARGQSSVPEPAAKTANGTEFPTTMGKVAPRELASHGITRFNQLPDWTARELLAIHGVGPKAIRILREELDRRGLSFRGE